MARQDGRRRVWPWVILLFAGLITTSGGGPGTETTAWLIVAAAITMIVRAVRLNRAARRTGRLPQPGRGQVPQQRRRSPAARNVRQLFRLLAR
jgi:hypothetical protein